MPTPEYTWKSVRLSDMTREQLLTSAQEMAATSLECFAKKKAQEPFSAAQPLDADRIARMSRWCSSHYETTCISGAAGLDMLAALTLANERIARLEKALSGIAEACDDTPDSWEDHRQCVTSCGHFRRARSVLKGDA